VIFPRTLYPSQADSGIQLEWVKQLRQDPKNLIIAVVRNPDKADLLNPFHGPGLVTVQGDVADTKSFPVGVQESQSLLETKDPIPDRRRKDHADQRWKS
jgi:hypothetical protein